MERQRYAHKVGKFTEAELAAMQKIHGKGPLDNNLSDTERRILNLRLVKKKPLQFLCNCRSLSIDTNHQARKKIDEAIAKLK